MTRNSKQFSWNHHWVRSLLLFAGAALVFVPDTASAHPVNADASGFYAGMMHSVTRLDHLLATLALGLLASQRGKHAVRWTLVMFPLALLAGTVAGSHLPGLPLLQVAPMLLVVGYGVLLAVGPEISHLIPVEALALLAGLILGFLTGNDVTAVHGTWRYIVGMAVGELLLVAMVSAWVPVASSARGRSLRTIGGVVFALVGMVLCARLVASGGFASSRSYRLSGGHDLLATIKSGHLTLSVIVGAIMGAMLWGAGHALTPGHGKAIVAAYLIGARSTAWHALYLGLTVTITHTFGIFVLGLIALFASHYVVPEQLYPWLGAISGLIVVGMGGMMLWQRGRPLLSKTAHEHHHEAGELHHHHGHLHSHDHAQGDGHSHLPPGANDEAVTWRSLLALGISGGILPCPSALVLLLAAVSLNRIAFGIVLVLAFSLGLAGVLTAVGLLFVKGSRLVRRLPNFGLWSRVLPVGSALVILLLGIGLTIEAISQASDATDATTEQPTK